MQSFTARLSTYLTRACVTVGICVALLALTPRSAAAITVCSAPGHCFTLSGIDSCEWINANLPDAICFLSVAVQGPTASVVKDGRGGAIHTFKGRGGPVSAYVLSDANAAKLVSLIRKGGRSDGILAQFRAIDTSPDRKVSDQRLAEIGREYKLKIGEAR